MKKDLYSPKRAAIVVTIALLASGVFVMSFLVGCATPDYSVLTIAEHTDDDISAAVTGANPDTRDSIASGKSGPIDPPAEISGGGRSRCK